MTPEQQAALARAITPQPGAHDVDFRVSIPCFGRRYYLTLLAGRKRRSIARLAQEGQLDPKRLAAAYFVVVSALVAPILALVAASMVLTRVLGIETLEPPPTALNELMHRQ